MFELTLKLKLELEAELIETLLDKSEVILDFEEITEDAVSPVDEPLDLLDSAELGLEAELETIPELESNVIVIDKSLDECSIEEVVDLELESVLIDPVFSVVKSSAADLVECSLALLGFTSEKLELKSDEEGLSKFDEDERSDEVYLVELSEADAETELVELDATPPVELELKSEDMLPDDRTLVVREPVELRNDDPDVEPALEEAEPLNELEPEAEPE